MNRSTAAAVERLRFSGCLTFDRLALRELLLRAAPFRPNHAIGGTWMFGKKKQRDLTRPDSSGTTVLAMSLLAAPRELTATTLLAGWKATWPKHKAPTEIEAAGDPSATAMTMVLNGLHATIAVVPTPIPGGELDGPAQTSWLWPDASADVAQVSAHVVVAVTGDASAVDAHRVLTRLVVAVNRATDALGVYWGAASHVVRADVFESMAQEYDKGGTPPLMLWIDFQGGVEGKKSSLFTVGLAAFGLMEMEIPGATSSVGDLREFAIGIAGYLIEAGPVIKDGDTVGETAEEKIMVRHVKSGLRGRGTIYQFEGL